MSLAPPTAFWTLPSVLSALPSAVSLASPSTLPAASLTVPSTCFAEPIMRSLSIVLFSSFICGGFDASQSPAGKLLRRGRQFNEISGGFRSCRPVLRHAAIGIVGLTRYRSFNRGRHDGDNCWIRIEWIKLQMGTRHGIFQEDNQLPVGRFAHVYVRSRRSRRSGGRHTDAWSAKPASIQYLFGWSKLLPVCMRQRRAWLVRPRPSPRAHHDEEAAVASQVSDLAFVASGHDRSQSTPAGSSGRQTGPPCRAAARSGSTGCTSPSGRCAPNCRS